MTNKLIKLRCPRKECRHVWDYGGESKFWASCPKCKTTVSFKKNRIEKEDEGENATGNN